MKTFKVEFSTELDWSNITDLEQTILFFKKMINLIL